MIGELSGAVADDDDVAVVVDSDDDALFAVRAAVVDDVEVVDVVGVPAVDGGDDDAIRVTSRNRRQMIANRMPAQINERTLAAQHAAACTALIDDRRRRRRR